MKKLLFLSLFLCGCSATYRQRKAIEKLDELAIQQPNEFARLSNTLNPCFSGKAKSDTVISLHTDTLMQDGKTDTLVKNNTVYITKTVPIKTVKTLTIHDTIADGRANKALIVALAIKSDTTTILKTQLSKAEKETNTWRWAAIVAIIIIVCYFGIKIYTLFNGGWMKKLIVILLLFGGVQAFGQQQIIKYPSYISYWNPKTLIPDSVIWTCSPHKKVADREAGFHSTGGRPNLTKDYSHSGYDIGHNCDASDENGNKTDEYNSFDFVNTFPQRPNLNRRVWLALEEQCRKLGIVRIKVSWRDTLRSIGPDHVWVPKICIKDIWYNGKHEHYEMPNADTVIRHSYLFYKRGQP